MAGMIKNIFGLDTQDVLEKRAERNRLLAAQRIKQGDIDPTVAILGQQFGDILGRGLMKRLGYEDPALTQAKENEALQEQFDNIDKSTAQGNYEAAQLLDKAGRPELAVQYRNVALRMAEQSKKITKKVNSTIPINQNDVVGSRTQRYQQLFDAGAYEAAEEEMKEIQKYKTLPNILIKQNKEIVDNVIDLTNKANKMEDIAERFDDLDELSGVAGLAAKKWKEFSGTEDEISILRADWRKIRADNTLDNLPPGAASDKDVQIVLGAFLSENANGKTAAKFLRGIAKMNKIKAEQGRFRVNYVKETKGNAGYLEAWEAYKKSDAFAKKLKKFGIGGKEEEATTSKPVKSFKIINGKIIQNK